LIKQAIRGKIPGADLSLHMPPVYFSPLISPGLNYLKENLSAGE